MDKVLDFLKDNYARVKSAWKFWFSSAIRLWLTIFTLIFLFSAISLLFYPEKMVSVTLFFPDYAGKQIVGEERKIPLRLQKEEFIDLLIRELALGPSTITLSPLIPKGVRVEKVLLRGSVLYVDFNEEMALNDKVLIPIQKSVEVIKSTIMYNTVGLSRIVITIGGHELTFLEPVKEGEPVKATSDSAKKK